MMALGFFSVAVLMAAITVQLALGIRLDGRLGIALGAMGIAYCYLASPAWGLIPVFFASSVILLYGIVGAAVKLWRLWHENLTAACRREASAGGIVDAIQTLDARTRAHSRIA